jgi:hypothetical protein
MLGRSLAVLTHPSAPTFAAQLGGATFAGATRYVALAALLAGVIAIPLSMAAAIGTFLTSLLGFAAFAWVTQRLSVTTTAQAAPIGRVATAFALAWAPLAVAASLLATVLIWAGVGPAVLAYAMLAVVAYGLYLAFVATGATLPRAAASTRIAIVVAAAAAAYLVDRLVWALVG